MKIGQLAKAAGVGTETIRFYEKTGLLEEPARRVSGYREYEQAAIHRLMFIRRAKELGFTLNEIKELLALRIARTASCGRVKRQAEVKIADIDSKLKTLRRMKSALQKLTTACDRGDRSTVDCPILESLEGDSIEKSA